MKYVEKLPELLNDFIESQESLNRTLVDSDTSFCEDDDGELLDIVGYRFYFVDRFGGLHCYSFKYSGETQLNAKNFYIPKTVLRRANNANAI